MSSGQAEVDIVLGKHDLSDVIEIVMLVLLHPEKLGCSETCVGDVGRIGGDLVLAYLVI